MSCPVAPGGELLRQLPLLSFEVIFVYLLITRFNIGFIVISVSFGLLCFLYAIYCKFKYKKMFDFMHGDSSKNDKYISIPANNKKDNIIVYCFKIPSKSVFPAISNGSKFPFAMPQNFKLNSSSIPSQEINSNKFIQLWKDQNNVIRPYCIDPFDLSIWFIGINNITNQQFNTQLSSNQYNYTQTCESFTSNTDCILYRISKSDFIKLCKSMQAANLIKNMKYMSSHLCLIYDTDFEDKCSTGDNLGYTMQLSSQSDDDNIIFMSNNCAFTGLQYRYVQLKRTMNKSEIKQFKSQLIMLFHHYFLFLYGTTIYGSNNKNDKVVLRMNSSDIFWNDFWFISLPGIKKIFIYQNIYKSIDIAYNKYINCDSMCYFLSLFCLDDLYIRYCTGYKYQYMLQECIDKFDKFHSDFLYHCCDDEDIHKSENKINPSEINIHTRDILVLSQRDTVIDLACQILAIFVYMMHCVGNKTEDEDQANEGIIEMKHNFYMIRYDTDLCDKGGELIGKLFERLGWKYDDDGKNEERIKRLLQSTQHKNYQPTIFNQTQQKRLSFLVAQYESVNYVKNIQ